MTRRTRTSRKEQLDDRQTKSHRHGQKRGPPGKGRNQRPKSGLTLKQLLERQRQSAGPAGIPPGTAAQGGGCIFGASGDQECPEHGLDPCDPPGGPAGHPETGHRVHDLCPDPGTREPRPVRAPDRQDVARHQARQSHGPEVPHESGVVAALNRDGQTSRSTAENLCWISSCGREVHGLRWDTTQQAYVRDTTVLRHERMQMSVLAKRLSTLLGPG